MKVKNNLLFKTFCWFNFYVWNLILWILTNLNKLFREFMRVEKFKTPYCTKTKKKFKLIFLVSILSGNKMFINGFINSIEWHLNKLKFFLFKMKTNNKFTVYQKTSFFSQLFTEQKKSVYASKNKKVYSVFLRLFVNFCFNQSN